MLWTCGRSKAPQPDVIVRAFEKIGLNLGDEFDLQNLR